MSVPRSSDRATRAGRASRAGLMALAAIAAALAAIWWPRERPAPSTTAPPDGTSLAPATTATPAVPVPPAMGPLPATAAAAGAPADAVPSPVVKLDGDGDLLKVSHRDQAGRFPLEYVETPEGTVTIRRTYDAAGRVLKEEASRDDQPVPMPAAR